MIDISKNLTLTEYKVHNLFDELPVSELTDSEYESLLDSFKEILSTLRDLSEKYSGESLAEIEEREYWANVLSWEGR